MELRAFAEQVLLATTLEEKLRRPKIITDECPGPPLRTPIEPGRPRELRFKRPGAGQADLPSVHQLENEVERGRLLHFFANHELLATELMALVLLRFPDAPAAFRRDVLQTLKDEQIHTQLYIQRMHKAGIRFGDLPVSGYFWRALSAMEGPMDYVAGLSLTFEQANLDFCRHFAHCFQEVGDAATARLLERVYRDEIGHVAYGLKWFRRWKNPGQTDWQAFCQQLKFPLSPQRAKGLTLNVEGRRAAGLGASFIAELNVFSQSKGRTPSVFVFNPFAEAYIAQGSSFTPVKHQALLSDDLASIPQFLCRQDDIVLLAKRSSTAFLHGIKQAGIPLPEFVELKQGAIDPDSSICQRKLGRLRPWAWGPDSINLLQPIMGNVTGEDRTERFNEQIAQLYSKAWSAAFLRKILPQLNDPGLCPESEIGVAVETLDEALATIETIRRRGHHKIVVKEAFGLAGHNSIRLWEPVLLQKQRRWMEAALEHCRQLVIEPWLEREMDFSVQLEMTTRGLDLCGYAGLINDLKGQYQSNWAAPNYQRRPPAEAAFLLTQTGTQPRLERLYEDIRSLLERELRPTRHLGPVGIDALVYRTPEGERRLKPIVEINPRYTMGRLTLELMKYTCPGTRGTFRLVNRALVRREGFPDLAAYAAHLTAHFPLRFEGEPVRKIRAGALCLNDPSQAQVCLAVFEVREGRDSDGSGHHLPIPFVPDLRRQVPT